MKPIRPAPWFVILLANLLLGWLAGLANNYLGQCAPLWFDHVSLHLYVGGLLVTYAALKLDGVNGFTCVCLTGLAYDAMKPVPFGTSLFLFGLVYATLLYGRQRFPREGEIFSTVLALLVNLFLFLAMSVLLVGTSPRPAETWLRLFTDLIASQLVILAITPWFIALQDELLVLLRPQRDSNRRFSP